MAPAMLAICRFFFFNFPSSFFLFVDGADSDAHNLPREERRMQGSKRKLEEAEHKEKGNGNSGEGGKLEDEEDEDEEEEREKSASGLRETMGVCGSRWSKATSREPERTKNGGWGVGVVADMLEKEEEEERVLEEEEERAKRAGCYESRSNRASIVREMKVLFVYVW